MERSVPAPRFGEETRQDVKLTHLEGIDHEALFDPAVLANISQLVKTLMS
jgi:hypothetical protein